MLTQPLDSKRIFVQKELRGAKKLLVFSLMVFLLLTLWNSASTIKVHKDYQMSLMDSVSQQVIKEYENHLWQLRLSIDEFQWHYRNELLKLHDKSGSAQKSDYIELLNVLRADIKDVRLFSIIDGDGEGIFKHITGDFLPICKEEIDSTIQHKKQEHLFFHRSASSVHYDLIQPLLYGDTAKYLFVAFNPTVFQEILRKYKLPQQELFLLRQDHVGKVEIDSQQYGVESDSDVVMSDDQIAEFSFMKAIPNTRWNVAIRLSETYNNNLIVNNYLWALSLWLIFSAILTISYFLQKNKSFRQIKMLQQLEFSKSHDNLTGLPNRDAFVEYFEQQKRVLQAEHGVAFVLDIDNFQSFNNLEGFASGDAALRQVTDLIKSLLPEQAKFARINNDQFAILDPQMPHDKAVDFAEVLRNTIATMELENSQQNCTLTACIGILEIDMEITNGEHAMSSLLLTNQLAKNKGHNQILRYQSDDPELVKHANEMEIFNKVQNALNQNSFELYRQEIKPTSSTVNNSSYEVLVRMKDNNGTMISPAIFIPIAEAHGLATEIDKWIVNKTLCQLSLVQSNDKYSINLSGQTLADSSMVAFVKQMFIKYQVNPELITFEITETFAITHVNYATLFISEISALGCNFALDDFGSGLSSFSYLQTLPVQKLKIDGVFITNIASSARNQAFVKTMVTLAKSMEMETVAEFVETEEDYTVLNELGLDFCQGYFFHKPEPWIE